MTVSPLTRLLLRIATGVGILFIWIPLLIIFIFSFNTSKSLTWPISGVTLSWYKKAFENSGFHQALLTSVEVGLAAMSVALILGTLVAFGVQRFKFFGRDSISFLVVLPIALPGIVTGMALNQTFTQILSVGLTMWTVVIAHSTFCIVVVYNNVIARLRRTARSMEEASYDLGGDTWTTFRRVTFPLIRSSLLAGAILAFALSFDEIVVTNFTIPVGSQTLPLWIYTNLSRPNQLPIINVVAVLLVIASIIPVYIAQKLGEDSGTAGSSK